MDKLIKVTLEFADKVQTLEGEQAAKWLEAVNGMCIMESVHGRDFPPFKWDIKVKD